jgi:hypothetical protein
VDEQETDTQDNGKGNSGQLDPNKSLDGDRSERLRKKYQQSGNQYDEKFVRDGNDRIRSEMLGRREENPDE